ncbi:MAG: hypothetical protein LBJ10_09425 [Clostridiales bacterium]|jgi:hypothetical protein|nr:hypothetical protein [Clostridiales bacterium]
MSFRIYSATRKVGIAVEDQPLESTSIDEDERARQRSRRIWQRDREHEMAAAIIGDREKWLSIIAEQDKKLAAQEKELAARDKEIAAIEKEIAKRRAQLGQSKLA